MSKSDTTSSRAGAPAVEPAPGGGTKRKRLGRREWIAIAAVATVLVAVAVTSGIVITQQNAQNVRASAAVADLAAVTEAQAELAAANADYASTMQTASADATVYQDILAKAKPADVFDAAAVQNYEAAVAELSALIPAEGTAAGVEQPAAGELSVAEVTDAYSRGGEDYETMRATLTGDANTFTRAANDVNAIRAELDAAREMIAEATVALVAATTLTPDTVLAELSLASDESKQAFTTAHSSVTALDDTSPVQAALNAISAYLDSHAAVRVSNETIAAERAAEEERIRQEQVGTITVATDFKIYLSFDQCILAPGVSYTQTFDISNGQNHTTTPDPARTSEIWTYTIDGGTVSFYKCYAD